jgi:ADP-heptose:LPS heptosyltransferase
VNQIHHILFVELLGGIGDVVIALPAIHALARSHPSARLTVLTFAPGSELLQTDRLIHRVIVAEPEQARSAVETLLAHEHFDLIVSDTCYDGIADIIQASGAEKTVTNLWRSPPDHERVGDRFLKILLAEGYITADVISPALSRIELTATETAIAHEALGAAYRPLIFLCPDAGMAIKQWPAAHFITLGRALQQRYQATVIVPVGSDPDQAMHLVEAIGGTARIWPRGPLRHLAAALMTANLVIAADTGIARIAAALTVPTITLFGPSWHGRYGQPAPQINLQGFPDCPERQISNFTEQRCWYSGNCPFEWKTCLEDISPESVLDAATKLLKPDLSRSLSIHIASSESSSVTSLHPDWKNARNLLVMRLDNVGDVIMTSPALRALKENLPQASLTLMASPSGALAAPLLPWVDQVVPWRVLWQDLGRLEFNPAREWQLINTLRDRQFDAAVIFTSFSQSPHPAALIAALAGISRRLGESKETDLSTLTHAIPTADDQIHQVDRNLRLIESVGFHVADRRLALNYSTQSLVDTPYLLLNPWTSCSSRNYDIERFAVAARKLSDITGYPIVVTGVETDRDRSHSLLHHLDNHAIDLIGATTLSELVALVAAAELVLTNNTSTMHIADATSTPSVVMFAGTEQESQWRPRYSPSRLLRRRTVCSPCYAFVCPYQLQCLDISPEAIVTAGLELLSPKGEG